MIVHFIIEWTVCRFQHARVLLSAPDAAQDQFSLTPSLSTKRRLELIGLTQIDGVQVLPRSGLFNSTDTWPQEGNTNNTKRPESESGGSEVGRSEIWREFEIVLLRVYAT